MYDRAQVYIDSDPHQNGLYCKEDVCYRQWLSQNDQTTVNQLFTVVLLVFFAHHTISDVHVDTQA